MKKRRGTQLRLPLLLLWVLTPGLAIAKDSPQQVIMWPPNGTSLLKFTFGKFKAVGSYSGQHNYVIDTVVENLWSKPFQNAAFSLYVFDKNQVRIGDGWISLTNMAPGETIKFQTNLSSAGTPSSMSLAPRTLPSELSAYLPPPQFRSQ